MPSICGIGLRSKRDVSSKFTGEHIGNTERRPEDSYRFSGYVRVREKITGSWHSPGILCNVGMQLRESKRMSDPFEREHSTDTHYELEEPKRFRVLMHNDDYTTMEFVVQILESVFAKNPSEATQIMLAIHRQGVGVCGVYPAEIAETKIARVHRTAREHGFPLKCSMEEA